MGFENLIEILLRMLLSSRAANSGRFHNFLYKFCSGNGTPVAATPKWEFAKSIQAKYAHFDKSDMSAIARFATNEERNWQLVRPCRVHLNTLDAHGRLCEKWMTAQHTPGRPAIITDRWVRWTPGTIISQTQTRDSSSIASRRYIYIVLSNRPSCVQQFAPPPTSTMHVGPLSVCRHAINYNPKYSRAINYGP